MTINDLRCDVCGRLLTGLADRPDEVPHESTRPDRLPGRPDGVRFVYHPGRPELRDTSGLACQACWDEAVRQFGSQPGQVGQPGRATARCAACGTPVGRLESLHLRRYDDPRAWRLCAPDAVDFLNRLRTVEPKLDPAAFRFPFADDAARDS